MVTREKNFDLGNIYETVKTKISNRLTRYVDHVYSFDDHHKKINFKTETLVPVCDPAKPNVLLLFSNPHPGSVQTGMFHCSHGSNPGKFWRFMKDAGWFNLLDIDLFPINLRNLFLDGNHGGPFNLYFDCYYDFPTEDPSHLPQIFGKDFFTSKIQPAAKEKLEETARGHGIDTIISFNGQVTSQITGEDTRGYIAKLNRGELIKYYLTAKDSKQFATIYQTYPTGYNYPPNIDEKRNDSLSLIRKNIVREKNIGVILPVEKVDIVEPSIIFRITGLYRPDQSEVNRYDVTRGYWRIGERKNKAQLAFSVVDHQILEVYEIVQWFPAGTTFSTHPNKGNPPPEKWEFIGNTARPEIRDKYINKSVAHYFKKGAKGPFRYVNI